MVNEICISTAYALGNDLTLNPPTGAVSDGYLLVMPLTMAGTCLIERMSEPIVTPGGSRMVLVNEALHENIFDERSAQLAWIVERLEYIAAKIGIRWAAQMARLLKGEKRVYYDLGRS